MTDFLMTLLGVGVAFASLMPLLKSGGQMIAAFMRRHQVMRCCAATLAHLCALFGGGLLVVAIAQGSNTLPYRILGAALLLTTVYAANWLIQKTILNDTP